MSPYFSVETGEMRDADLYADAPDPSEPSLAAPIPAATTLNSITPHVIVSDPLQARDEIQKMLDDTTHPAWDLGHPAHDVGMKRYLELVMLERGENPLDPAQNPVLGEVFANGQIRPLGADALSPAPRPTLPEGHEWEEAALVDAETEAHAYGLPPDLVMTATDRLREAVEQAEARGVTWGPGDGEAELLRRYGREGAQRKADAARFGYQVILESEAPRVVESVTALGKDWGNDPGVIEMFAAIFDAVCSAPMTPKLEALFLRHSARQQAAEEAARAEGAKIRQEADAEDDEARAAVMTTTAQAHQRWRRSEP